MENPKHMGTKHMGTGNLCGEARTSVPVPMCVSEQGKDAHGGRHACAGFAAQVASPQVLRPHVLRAHVLREWQNKKGAAAPFFYPNI